MTDDVRISTGLRRHRKTKRLKRILGSDGCWALVCLFLWAGEERWTGDLSGLSDADIEEEADWDGKPGALVAALLEVGYLDGAERQRNIHAWSEHNPYAASKGARIERGKKGAKARWNKDSDCSEHAPSMRQAQTSNAHGQCPPAPAPAPTPAENLSVANATGAGAPAVKADPIWDTGLAFLIRKGIPIKPARGLLGQLRKAAGDIQCGAILADAEAQDISDPAPWLMKAAANAKARGSPNGAPVGKTMQAIQALQEMKNGLALNRDHDGVSETALLEFGKDSGGRGNPRGGSGLV